jgi:hypothetical protein
MSSSDEFDDAVKDWISIIILEYSQDGNVPSVPDKAVLEHSVKVVRRRLGRAG